MRSFSLSRVANYARYHYVTERRNYAWYWLGIVGIPLLFAVLSQDAEVAIGLSMVCYGVSAFAIPLRTIAPLRTRGKSVLAMALPVSNEERWVFAVFNLAVVMPLAVIIASMLALYCATYFDPGSSFINILKEHGGGLLSLGGYVVMQIVASMSLLVGLLSRRVVLTYFLLFLGFVVAMRVFVGLLENVDCDFLYNVNIQVDVDVVEAIVEAIGCLVPVVLYGFCYLAFRRRQMKW